MPHITFKNLDIEKTETFINDCTDALAKEINCPPDWIVFYSTMVKAYVDKKATTSTCFVKVEWFARDEQVKHNVAQMITTKLQELGIEEVVVEFTILEPANYYENMEQF